MDTGSDYAFGDSRKAWRLKVLQMLQPEMRG